MSAATVRRCSCGTSHDAQRGGRRHCWCPTCELQADVAAEYGRRFVNAGGRRVPAGNRRDAFDAQAEERAKQLARQRGR